MRLYTTSTTKMIARMFTEPVAAAQVPRPRFEGVPFLKRR